MFRLPACLPLTLRSLPLMRMPSAGIFAPVETVTTSPTTTATACQQARAPTQRLRAASVCEEETRSAESASAQGCARVRGGFQKSVWWRDRERVSEGGREDAGEREDAGGEEERRRRGAEESER
eukprot:2882153-Rhodomonas_salina.1